MDLCEGIKNSHIARAERITIKVGSSLLIDLKNRTLNQKWFDQFIQNLAELRNQGKEIIVVSSGAVALGRKALKTNTADDFNKTEASACAAIGQIELAHAYQESLKKYDIPVGLVLITTHNTETRDMYLNLRDTIDTLLLSGAIPIVNENDAVSNDDNCYGDNDRLAARIAGMSGSDLLILFSDIDGLYTDNPRKNKNAKFIPHVEEITDKILSMASGAGSDVGTGGMATKLAAAIIARSAGCDMMIADGTQKGSLKKLINGTRNTFFPAGEYEKNARKHWIIGTPKPSGSVIIDNGAIKALYSGSSLLPVGITDVQGEFVRGDCILVLDEDLNEIARGLAGYDSKEIFKILGRKTKDISKLLGYVRRPECIHRNNLVLTELQT